MMIDLSTFTIIGDRGSILEEAGVVYDETRDVTFPGSTGEVDALVGVQVGVDGMFDIVVADHHGFDKIQVLDRAIEALRISRENIARLSAGAELDAKCLDQNPAGDRCDIRGLHDEHHYVKDTGL